MNIKIKHITTAILLSTISFLSMAQSADSTSNGMAANFTNGPVTLGADNLAGTVQGQILANNTLINAELAKRDATIANLQNQLNTLKTSGSGGSIDSVCPDLPNQHLVNIISGVWQVMTLKRKVVFKEVSATNGYPALTCEVIIPNGYLGNF